MLFIPLVIGGITAGNALVSRTPAPKYVGTSTLLLEGGAASANYPDLIVTRPVLKGVIDQADLPLRLDEIQAMVSARKVPNTQFLEISATGTDRAMVRRVAYAVAVSFVGLIEESRQAQFGVQREEMARQLSGLDLFSTDVDVVDTIRTAIENRMPVYSRVSVAVPAEEPRSPIPNEPNHLVRNSAMAAAAGFLLSIVVVILLEFQRAPLGSPSMFQRRFGLTHLGTVPRWSKSTVRNRELAVNSGISSGGTEAIRQVATNIEFGASRKGVKSFVITSPELGEGRSSVIANLRYALSSSMEKVVLVDADLRSPSLHAYFKLENSAGLSDFLSDPAIELEDVLRDTVYSGVKVITSGGPAADPVGLLKSPRMGTLLRRLETEYHMVLVDTPPMVSLADGAVVAAQVGGAVMVVNTSTTRLDAVGLALGNLEKAGANMLGFIWNGAASGSPAQFARYQKHCKKQSKAPAVSQLAPGATA